MKAIVYSDYGSPDVLHLKEIPTPAPKDNEILVRVHAASVNFGDLIARKFNTITPKSFSMPSPLWLPTRLLFGFNSPKKQILGSEFAGVVEATGNAVKRFQTGDSVFGYRGMNMGAYAEYLCVPEDGLVALKPSTMTFEDAATVPYGALTALSLLKKGRIKRGEHVLINGASGGIGSFAVQLANVYGARVTGVCSTRRMEFVRSLGADRVIDYTREDFTREDETYDLIFDVPGTCSFSACKHSLKPHGRYQVVSFKMKQLMQMVWTSLFGRRKVICALSSETLEELLEIKELADAGKIKTIVDRAFPMEHAAEAHRYAEDGQKKGHIVITMIPTHQN
jgi:NADPH:quinone reductase-like Zn-dependent oxidoreductase